MTIVLKSEIVNNHLIEIRQEKYENCYKVSVARMIDEYRAGGRLDDRTYSSMAQAKRRFRDLKKQVVNWG